MSEVRFQEAAFDRYPMRLRDMSQMRNGNDEIVTGRRAPTRFQCVHPAEIVPPLGLDGWNSFPREGERYVKSDPTHEVDHSI